ncbi:MAG: hypothetical protein APF84_18355 [Gracilibacter sp. BRH_c7a]|nr:MAG: hypothetical protein APF84_18355 [Gracilibacter sp. BRH_c7a]
MKNQVIKIFGNIIAIYIATALFSEISAATTTTIVVAGFILWLVNITIRPLLTLITIPINLLTLGLFSLIINTWMVMLVGRLIEGFYIQGFWAAFGLAILVAFFNIILGKMLKSK